MLWTESFTHPPDSVIFRNDYVWMFVLAHLQMSNREWFILALISVVPPSFAFFRTEKYFSKTFENKYIWNLLLDIELWNIVGLLHTLWCRAMYYARRFCRAENMLVWKYNDEAILGKVYTVPSAELQEQQCNDHNYFHAAEFYQRTILFSLYDYYSLNSLCLQLPE